MKRVFIIHRWGGSPDGDWYPWLNTELEGRGCTVNVPAMPDSDSPRIEAWVSKIAEIVGAVDKETYFVGHSIGCQAIIRYLEALPGAAKIGGAVFVAGWITELTNLEDDNEVRVTAKMWLETPIDFKRVRNHLTHATAIFSDNDQFVPATQQEIFKNELRAKIIVEQAMAHFDDVAELPIVRDELLAL